MSDGRTVVLPDYSGNRFMTSLGNIEATPLASLTFISFLSGSVLYLTGIAKNLIGPAAQDLMPLHSQHALTTIHITGYTHISDALPVRQRPESTPLSSPYSPPVRFLAEEPGGATRIEGATATLTKIRMHSPTIATFTWSPSSSSSLSFSPGQAAILDFTPLLGQRAYQHMAQSQPTSVNDDRIRTWTVSSVNRDSGDSETSNAGSFSLTMREKPGGAVTGALFSIARKLQEVKPELLEDTRPISLTVGLVGVTGDFVLPSQSPPTSSRTNKFKLAWFAGGIGVTPFLAMLRGLGEKEPEEGYEYDIRLVLSAREPEVFVPLIEDALRDLKRARARAQADERRKVSNVALTIDFFSNQDVPELYEDGDSISTGVTVVLRSHKGRVTREGLGLELEEGHVQGGMDLKDREMYVCGPGEFEQAILGMLVEVGVDRSSVRTEGFEY
ncbi:hypothetical protein H0H93_016731 [Arthromyces matolae]|nr:hypothetical protein H0H93_016731 [Arthromyces matolae]